MTLLEWIIAVLMLVGAGFVLVASLGMLRMPDIFLRMSAATKAATLGIGFLLVATAVYFQDVRVTSRAVATILFLLLTAPVAAHRLARASYFVGAALAEETFLDELKEYYDEQGELQDNAETPMPEIEGND